MGSHSYLVAGGAADRIVDFTKAISLDENIEFDPSHDVLLAVSTTEDEEDLFVNILDRRTGLVEEAGDGPLGMVDYSSYVDEDRFTSIFPLAKFPDLLYEEASADEIIEKLLAGSEELPYQMSS